jgi:hypothetical protein
VKRHISLRALAVIVLLLAGMAAAETPKRVTILYDAFGKSPSLTMDWGFAALVEYGGKRIPFDLEIDNSATERAIRGVAVGGNNWVFFGSDQGGTTAAVLRSFVASCQRAGVDPFTWLKDVLSRIAAHPITRPAKLLRHNWVTPG